MNVILIKKDLKIKLVPHYYSRSGWHPAKDIARRLRKELMIPMKPVYTLTNIPELTGS